MHNPAQNRFLPVSRVFARISFPNCAYPPALPDILQYLPDSYEYIPCNSPWHSRSVHRETPVCQMTYLPEPPAYPWPPPFQKACHIPDNSAPYHKNTACNYCLIHDIPYTKYAPECSQPPHHNAPEIQASPLIYFLCDALYLISLCHLLHTHKESSHQSSATSRPAFP